MSDPAPRADRREFITQMSTLAVGAGALAALAAPTEAAESEVTLQPGPPVLQNPTSSAMAVAWSVNRLATGYVEYGETPELGQRAYAPETGLNPLSSRFLQARLTGLTPGKKIYYRTVTTPITFANAYRIEQGDPIESEVYAFETPSADAAAASFAVINDTHEKLEVLKAATSQLAADPADVTVWNGDIFNDIRSDDQIVAQVLRPADAPYASTRPILFTSGNHDVRGSHARALSAALLDWPDQGALGRNFAVRQGPLALIGLDTGEDKPDAHPVFAGLANFEPYREAQGAWLAETLQRAEIASAPYLVIFCHIPLWGLPGDNPGDTLEGYASYCRQAQRAWHPHLAKAGAQLLICGHTHRFRYDAPTDERAYGQMVGGGPSLSGGTIIRGRADSKELKITATSLDGKSLGEWSISPRQG
ncbi:metallophosphoesterase [Blastopirellula sp. JC732]|uniref:Metallophosphoesterase n=1 Tax=Blastopirellula sediminis TaxID=2894196 RepID=A0A9X1MRK5_9BACT|nr:metallophosphoesterase [Blastopirellula sediminis]MCC9605575.1 metallophosphoesterase [Blastopirellula sediminis]MCC9631125.1 metallophosphoesterase [Blastopirellula sediminis]